jgi:hypothetical protein
MPSATYILTVLSIRRQIEELKNDDNCDIFILQINLMDDARINSRFDSDYHSKKLFMKSPVG